MSRLFNAGTEKVDFGSITETIPFSMGAWVYPTATISANAQIIGSNDSASTHFWRLHGRATNKIAIRISFSGGTAYSYSADSTLVLNTWQFVAGVVTSTGIEIYHGTTPFNIASVESTSVNPSGTHTTAAYPTTVGNSDDDTYPFAGKIDNAWMVNSELTLQELKVIALKSYDARNDFKLFAPLDGIHSSEIDFSGNGYTGTVTGATRDTGSPVEPVAYLSTPYFLEDDDAVIGVVGTGDFYSTNFLWGNY